MEGKERGASDIEAQRACGLGGRKAKVCWTRYEIRGLDEDGDGDGEDGPVASFVGGELAGRALRQANDEIEPSNVDWERFLAIAGRAGFGQGGCFLWVRAGANFTINRSTLGRALHFMLKTAEDGNMANGITYRAGNLEDSVTDVAILPEI